MNMNSFHLPQKICKKNVKRTISSNDKGGKTGENSGDVKELWEGNTAHAAAVHAPSNTSALRLEPLRQVDVRMKQGRRRSAEHTHTLAVHGSKKLA